MADLRKIVASNQQQKQAFKEQKQAEREELNKLQDAAVMAFTSSPAAYHAYLEMQAQNPMISAGNVALAYMQNPEATMINTLERWNRLGRAVQRGESGIKILIPEPYKDDNGHTRTGYRIGRAFDVSQTHGTRLPPRIQLQEDTQAMEKAITALVNSAPVPVVPLDDFESGSFYDPTNKQIIIQPGLNDFETFALLAKEIAHARYHDAYGSYYLREDVDIDADSISFMVCRQFGVPAESPAAANLGEHYAEQTANERRGGLGYLQSLSEHLGKQVMRELAPPQRERQGQGQPEK